MTRRAGAKRAGVSVTLVLAGLFATSVAIRLAGGTAVAIAREIDELTSLSTNQHSDDSPGRRAAEIDLVMAEIGQRRDELEARAARLDLRERDVEAAALAVQTQLERLAEAEARLQQTLALAQGAAAEDVAQLTSVYENMKPAEASEVFEEMDPSFAAGFLGRMRPESAARIIAGLDPATAYSISVILAGRHAKPAN